MLLHEPLFLGFLAAVLLVQWRVIGGNEGRKRFLLVASYVFYAAWDPRFLALIVGSTLVDHQAALRIAGSDDERVRRRWLVVSLVTNLGILAVFKYLGFFADSLADLVGRFGGEPSRVTLGIVLPVGISFFTFQSMSYTIDVHRGVLEARRRLLDVALFVAFFPQLVAGPIVRAARFLPQLDVRRSLDGVAWRPALLLFAVGFVKKAVLADSFAGPVDRFFADPDAFDGPSTVLSVLGYSAQIYCDFSGYSDMAIAAAAMLGYSLGENFRYPYFASSIDRFWRRWHISLSDWLRDYLYIPLGGNRGGRLLTYRNLLLTMVLGGLWHGAAWTFIIWGALHGAALAVTRAWAEARGERRVAPGPVGTAVATLATFWFVSSAWIFFRADSFSTATTVLARFLTFSGAGSATVPGAFTAFLVGALVLHWLGYRRAGLVLVDRVGDRQLAALLGAGAAVAVALTPVAETPFIYFQF